jgi:hypothetical protein
MKSKSGTTVTFFRRSDGCLTGFLAKGHADYGRYGSDIVCAAVSALTQATLGGLTDVVKVPVMYDVDETLGLLEARLTPEATGEQLQQAQILLKTLEGAIRQMERNYPRNVHISFEERR